MNPLTRLLLLAAAVLSCGRSVPIENLPAEVEPETVEDSLVEVRVGAIGHCTRSRLGRVECASTGDADPSLRFTLVERGAVSLSVGGGFGYCGNWLTVCALMEGGRVSCARNGTHVCTRSRYERPLAGAQALSLSAYRACVLEADGDVLCGGDLLEQLVPIPGMENSVAISCGAFACCSVNAEGAVNCLADGSLRALPHSLPSPAVAVSVGRQHACALDGSGVPHCWGLRSEELPGTPLTAGQAVSAGGDNTCVLDSRGIVFCGASSVQPFDVPLLQMEAGVNEVCGLDLDGELRCAPRPVE
jgi:hypothetical protein